MKTATLSKPLAALLTGALSGGGVSIALAQEVEPPRISSNFYGVPGLIETPSATAFPDGEMVGTVSSFGGITRFQYVAQVHPRLAGGFRYSQIKNFDSAGFATYYDRSFDLRFTLLEESDAWPAVTVGLQDFVGTGIYSGEYVVLTKALAPGLSVTAGLGWGRLSGDGLHHSGFGTRPKLTPAEVAEGGRPNVGQLFRGEIGSFGGISWTLSDQLTLKLEYSSDVYSLEAEDLGVFNRKSPLNFGIEYAPSEEMAVGAYYLYGTEIGLMVRFNFNPDRPPANGSLDPGPIPVLSRPSRAAAPAAYATEWSASVEQKSSIRTQVAEALLTQRLQMEGLSLSAGTAELYVRNLGYMAEAQALGRAARVLTRLLPSSVEEITIVPVTIGMPLARFTFSRTDLETLAVAPDGTERSLVQAKVTDSATRAPAEDLGDGLYPHVSWSISPFTRISFFDPNNPVRGDAGVELAGGLTLAPGLSLNGAVRKTVIGNLDDSTRESNSELPHVRSDFVEYDSHGDPNIEVLTAAYHTRLAGPVYGRLTVGYLERMYAGVSSELLWAPYDSRAAVGIELNYVQQRDFEGGFGLQDYEVATGHASLYYRVTDDYLVQVDAGQYLAGDVGGTLSVSRTFANGWSVGAFATITDVPADEFGEGSFDKGISLTMPLAWFNGKSTPTTETLVLRPLQRDGGAKLSVRDRLYGKVSVGQRSRVEEQWGRFWR